MYNFQLYVNIEENANTWVHRSKYIVVLSISNIKSFTFITLMHAKKLVLVCMSVTLIFKKIQIVTNMVTFYYYNVNEMW